MSLDHLQVYLVRLITILAIVGGMLGATPIQPAHAATLVVTNPFDSGPGSLRQAIEDAETGSTITFDPTLAGGYIFLHSRLMINKELTIDGSALNPALTLSGQDMTRIIQAEWPAEVTISGLTLTDGRAMDGSGGAVQATGTFTAINSTFVNNYAVGSGGAIWGGMIKLINSTVSQNHASENGGAITSVSLRLENTTVTGNQANNEGGAISIWGDGALTIVNSTITQNQAGTSGGGMFLTGYPLVNIYNSTFAENTALNGYEVSLDRIYSITLKNTIFVCNGEREACYVTADKPILSTNSILGTGTLPDYGLAPLGDNGGPTQTMALVTGSPLIDAGDDATCAGAPANNVDQRGLSRLQGSHCDIGAYEDQSLVRYVRQGATGTNDGSSWANAHTDLQSALAVASPDEEIWVAAGTYKPTSALDRTISFHLKNGVAIYGGFAGTETARDQRNSQTNLTILSGDIGIAGNTSDNSYHIVVGSDTNQSAILDGFTVTRGNANNTTSSEYYLGGGMYINQGNPRLNGLVFTNNYASFGAGIYTLAEGENALELILTNMVFRNNIAAREGGGMNARFSPHPPSGSLLLRLTNVSFESNTAAGGTGGGLINNGGKLELTHVTFVGNTALGGGGLSHIPYGPSTLTNVIFSNNYASEGGGGILIGSSGPNLTTLTNVTFNNNSTALKGGGIANAGESDLDLTNVTFSGNTAGETGGGLSNGGILGIETSGRVNLIHTTFSNNTATSNDSAIYNEGGNLNIHNSILYGDIGHEIADDTGTAAVTYNIVQGGYPGVGNLDEDPLLGPLQDNGGFTKTMALEAGSPALDGADDTNCPATDQRGVARPQGGHCDMGAYESDKSTIDVQIGTSRAGSYFVAPHESQRTSYVGVNTGPVKITNTDALSSMAAERVIYKVNGLQTSFSELMGLPDSQLDTVYWLPWYNNVDLDTQLRLANVSGSTTTVRIFIDGEEVTPVNGITLLAGQSTRVSYTGVNAGPVQIVSDQTIIVAERVIYKVKGISTSFSEMMALPDSQLDKTYSLPWYNNVDLDTQLRFANTTDQPATVHIFIDGQEMGSGFALAPGQSTRQSFAGINAGPVEIVSDQNVIAAARVIYKVNGVQTSFSETIALPDNQLDTTHWLPWYNNIDLDTQLRFANVTDQPATVHVFIGGQEMGTGFTLDPGESKRQSFAGINDGPVKIVSDQNIVVAERVIYRVKGVATSFSELMALPDHLLDSTFWFPWYNNVDLDTQLRFGLP